MKTRTFGRIFGLSLASACTLALAAPVAAQNSDPQPISALDLATLPRLGGVTVSPDGNRAIYNVRATDRETFERSGTFYLLDLTRPGSAPVALTLPADVADPQFGSDGMVYFMSDRPDGPDEESGNPRVWRMALAEDGTPGEASVVLDIAAPFDGYALSPTGNAIAIWGTTARECEQLGCEDAADANAPSGRLYEGDAGFVRHWDSWVKPGKYSRVFMFGLEDGVAVGDGAALDGPHDAAGAPTGNTPTRPFGGSEDIAWAPNGQSVYFVARQTGAAEPMSTNLDIWHSRIDQQVPANITDGNEALDALPTPSPDGKWLAYVAMARPGYESDRQVIHLRDTATGNVRALTTEFDRSFGSLAWSPDSRWIYATAQDVLDTPVFRIDPRSGAVTKLDLLPGNEAHIGDVRPLSGNRLLFRRDSVAHPAELFLWNGKGAATRLTDVAFSQTQAMAAVETTRFKFAGAGGAEVWGQIHKPSWAEGELPVVLYVHGGPQGSFNDGWSTRWNPRTVASQGYAVVSVDFHGSTGYGQAFTDSINADWGGKPLEDLQLGLAAALELDPQIDGERACAMGASYGGYMMNWIAGNWPDRFDCLVQHDGLFDMRSFYYTTEELWFPRWDFGGSYAEQSELYERWNPVNYVDNWKTPMLVIAGEQDFRVPYTQGIASFTALQERGVPSQLLVFPDENHWVLKPKNSVQWHNTVFDWLARWLKP
ncbi:alpha/beta hydrolase family protein [Paraurantiacibacter namhicola]|uniref:Prolyl tripeptidyl peptidase n=1 Tax=Paraurantiacibacter namhicola TaxID=645517 RepID=A0A1C7D613_9SPHN|nr:S9 family peptidase [Paraurantiacibacter namhicola]ANU06771.1 Prolyl tripeptidyl peptidase precursor [Paraurantiacibacter namhicola]